MLTRVAHLWLCGANCDERCTFTRAHGAPDFRLEKCTLIRWPSRCTGSDATQLPRAFSGAHFLSARRPILKCVLCVFMSKHTHWQRTFRYPRLFIALYRWFILRSNLLRRAPRRETRQTAEIPAHATYTPTLFANYFCCRATSHIQFLIRLFVFQFGWRDRGRMNVKV